MKPTFFKNTEMYPVVTIDDAKKSDDFYLELCHSKIVEVVHVIPHLPEEHEGNLAIMLDRDGALEVMAFLKEFILNG